MVAVKKRKPATIQNTNESVRRCSAESNAPVSRSWRQSWYLRNCESLYTEGRLGRCCTGLLLRFVVQCRFAYEAWPSTGRGVARASRIRENKNRENFFWRVWTLFRENLHQRKFPLYGNIHRWFKPHYSHRKQSRQNCLCWQPLSSYPLVRISMLQKLNLTISTPQNAENKICVIIMAYGCMPYVGMTLKKVAATLKVMLKMSALD